MMGYARFCRNTRRSSHTLNRADLVHGIKVRVERGDKWTSSMR